MISEGSCDTEDWSNDAEHSALITEINYILKYIKIENCNLNFQGSRFKVLVYLSHTQSYRV